MVQGLFVELRVVIHGPPGPWVPGRGGNPGPPELKIRVNSSPVRLGLCSLALELTLDPRLTGWPYVAGLVQSMAAQAG